MIQLRSLLRACPRPQKRNTDDQIFRHTRAPSGNSTSSRAESAVLAPLPINGSISTAYSMVPTHAQDMRTPIRPDVGHAVTPGLTGNPKLDRVSRRIIIDGFGLPPP